MNDRISHYLFTCFLSLLTFSLLGQEVDFSQFKIYSSSEQKILRFSELIAAVEEADVLFFGEEHNDSLGHWMQDTLYRALLQQYGTASLSLEMFETDCQLVLDEYLADIISEEQLIKDGRAWKNYREAYSPLVEAAKAQNQFVIAANAPRRYVRLVGRKGLDALNQLSKAARQFLPPLPIYTDDSTYYQRFREIMGGVGHGMQDNFFYSQCLWDASMAYQIFRHWKQHKQERILHLNGRFHTDHQQGTFTQLQRLHKKIQLQNISCFPVEDFDEPDWSTYAANGDYIILTRKRDEEEENDK